MSELSDELIPPDDWEPSPELKRAMQSTEGATPIDRWDAHFGDEVEPAILSSRPPEVAGFVSGPSTKHFVTGASSNKHVFVVTGHGNTGRVVTLVRELRTWADHVWVSFLARNALWQRASQPPPEPPAKKRRTK